jgi:hypothetical protein
MTPEKDRRISLTSPLHKACSYRGLPLSIHRAAEKEGVLGKWASGVRDSRKPRGLTSMNASGKLGGLGKGAPRLRGKARGEKYALYAHVPRTHG